ncbi:MAG: hypothetical protein HQK75_12310 [Candidatus Magnetomorum sp.]|nr:hypothetical protein [Candidatus Magnetomorum sp.]
MRTLKCLLLMCCVLGVYVFPVFAAEGIKFDFHGQMLQVVGSTNNSLSLAGKHKSGPTDFFSYDGRLNSKGFETKYMDYLNSVGTTFGLSKARLRFEAQTEDELAKFVYGLEVGTINWGDKEKNFGLSGDGLTQETRFAYAEVQAVQGVIQHIVRAGLQPTNISDWVWSETAAGLTYHGKTSKCNWMTGWYRGDENAKSNNTDNNYFVLKTDGEVSSNLNVGFFFIYEDSGAETTESDHYTTTHTYDRINSYLGLTANLKQDSFFANFELIYQYGDIRFVGDSTNIENLERGAYLMNLDMGIQVNKKLKLSFNSLYASGDDNPNDQDADNFDAIDVDVKVGMILFKDSLTSSCDRFVSDAPYLLDKGLIHHALMAEYKPDKKHKFFSAIRYLSTAKDVADDKSFIGTELDFKYAYKYNKYVSLHFESACLIPGEASDLMTADGKNADTIVNVSTGIKFKF